MRAPHEWGSAPTTYCIFHLRVASPAALPPQRGCRVGGPALRLDDAEKRRSSVFVRASSAWVPVTHASVTPLRDVFQTSAVASLAVGRAADAPPK